MWEWFWQLDSGRTANGFCLNPIPWSDLLAWMFLTGVRPTQWELDALRELDWIRVESSLPKKGSKGGEDVRWFGSPQELKAALRAKGKAPKKRM